MKNLKDIYHSHSKPRMGYAHSVQACLRYKIIDDVLKLSCQFLLD